MADYASNPLVNFNFVLRVEALYDLPCKSVKAFTRANEFEYVQEGGLNDYVHMLRKPISQPFTFQVERYVGVQMLDPLTLGTELILPVVLMVNRMYGNSQTVRYYVFTGCVVISKDYGELDSERSGLLTETTTLSYRELYCVDFPSVGGSAGTWEFDKTTKAGKGTQSAKHVAGEASKADFEKNVVLWDFDGLKKKGNGVQSAAPNPKGELDKAQMEKLGRKWPKTKSAVGTDAYLKSTAEPEGRKWPKTKSAVGTDAYLTSAAEPEGRKWPATKSAVGTDAYLTSAAEPTGRKWPPTQSAVGTDAYLTSAAEPTGRKWPPTQSAVGTDAYLTSSAEPTGRKWPPTKSAVSYPPS